MRTFTLLSVFCLLLACQQDHSHHHHTDDQTGWIMVQDIEAQPLMEHIRRLVQNLSYIGVPISDKDQQRLNAVMAESEGEKRIREIQEIIDPYCLLGIHINAESRVKAHLREGLPIVYEKNWKTYLVKVHNEAGVTAPLQVAHYTHQGKGNEDDPLFKTDLRSVQRWEGPVNLTGLELNYAILDIYSRDSGKREATLTFDVGQGTQDLGFRSELPVLFQSLPTYPLNFLVKDEDGNDTRARFTVRDAQSRVFPSQLNREPPDFWFHPQVYRETGESIRLPKGSYEIAFARGPEYRYGTQEVEIAEEAQEVSFQLERWFDASDHGYWSGDHHIHAAGCSHYTDPSKGVHPEDMYNHVKGEDLKIGSVLTWGPGFDYQKQFFSGKVDEVSEYPNLIRYDVEVSQFGSHESGHLCLLRLSEQMYPGGESKHHWPTLGLNTLRWAKKQGAITGPAHSGWGLIVPTQELPNYIIPPYSSIGANEYIVDVTHKVPGPDGVLVPAVDFLSVGDTEPFAEMNMWYHTLNCGFRTRISGETDFPCIKDDRVGMWRSYVKLAGDLTYDDWCQGVQDGNNYVSDGLSHLMNFQVEEVEVGTNGSEVRVEGAQKVTVTLDVIARLPETSEWEADHSLPDSSRMWASNVWDLERSRIEGSRKVPVELVVNGEAVSRQEIKADGKLQELTFSYDMKKSSWVAVRIFPASHTNPIFVIVDGQPIRASKKSAEWCLKGVDRCWQQKERFYAEEEMEDALAAYAHARKVYDQIIQESLD